MDLRLDRLPTHEHLLAYGGLGGGRTCKGCVSLASNQRNSQILQTSILIPPLLSTATSIIGLLQEGQGRALLPSLWIAWSHSGLIDSPVKVRRNNCKPTARPSHFSQRQIMPLSVRISVNGIRQAGQRSSIAATCSGGRASCKDSKLAFGLAQLRLASVWLTHRFQITLESLRRGHPETRRRRGISQIYKSSHKFAWMIHDPCGGIPRSRSG